MARQLSYLNARVSERRSIKSVAADVTSGGAVVLINVTNFPCTLPTV